MNDLVNDPNLEAVRFELDLTIDLANDLSLVVVETKAVLVRTNDLSSDPNLEVARFVWDQNLDLAYVLDLERKMSDLDLKVVENRYEILNRSLYLFDLFQGPNLEPTRRLCKSQGHQGLKLIEGFSLCFYCTTSSVVNRFNYFIALIGLSASTIF